MGVGDLFTVAQLEAAHLLKTSLPKVKLLKMYATNAHLAKCTNFPEISFEEYSS